MTDLAAPSEWQLLPGLDAPQRPDYVDTTGWSVGRKRTLRHQQDIARGIHPLTKKPLLGTGQTCVDCASAREDHGFWKCILFSTSRSETSDLRVGWPACTLFKERQP